MDTVGRVARHERDAREPDAWRIARSARPRALRGGRACAVGSGLSGRPASRRLARGGRGSDAGDLCARVPQLALVHARHEPARLAAADPDEPQHRPRPPAAAHAGHAAARGRRLLPLQQARGRPATEPATRSAWSSVSRRTTSSTALSAVPHDFRDVVVLVDIGDFTYADAAQILDIPIGTVMSRLHRGRRILKQAMAESAVGGEES